MRDGVPGGVEVLAQRADDVAFGEDAGDAVAVHDQRGSDALAPHHGRRLGHGVVRIDRDDVGAHDLANGGHVGG